MSCKNNCKNCNCQNISNLKITLLNHTPEPEKLVSAAAKLCYSKSDIQNLYENQTPEKVEEFINKLISNGHESPLEHISFTFGIEGVTRSLTHQLVRHRIGCSYCLSGDTIVGYDNKVKGITIKQLYKKTKQYRNMIKIRSINENTKEIFLNNIVDIIYSGKKPLYEVETEDGYKVKTTMLHYFFTQDGWKQLEHVNVGDNVYTNGIDCYRNKDWLYQKFHIENLTSTQIAKLCGVSGVCIKKWIAKFKMQKPLGYQTKGKEPVNKGKTKENYEPLMRVSEKMKGNKNHRNMQKENNPWWKGGKNRKDISKPYAHSIAKELKKDINYCENCGRKNIRLEVHHKDNNCRNNNINNLIKLCCSCHRQSHLQNNSHAYKNIKTGKYFIRKVVKLSKIKRITYIGIEDTYDIEMKEPYHNFIANGFVVHNSQKSQRYVNEQQFKYIIPDQIKNNYYTKKLYNNLMGHIQEQYNYMFNVLMFNKIKDTENIKQWDKYNELFNNKEINMIQVINEFKEFNKKLYLQYEKSIIEDVRYILPNATETKIVTTMNFRALINFCRERTCNRAQWEIRQMALEMVKLIKPICPNLYKLLCPKCVSGMCQEGYMSCGKSNEMKELFNNI